MELEPWLVAYARAGRRVRIVSDRSFAPNIRAEASAWAIGIDSEIYQYIFGNNIVLGLEANQCPHHSELSGLIGVLLY